MDIRLKFFIKKTLILKIFIFIVLTLFFSCSKNNSINAPEQIPAVPILNSPQNASTITINNPVFKWENVSDAIQYRIQISVDSNFSTKDIDEYVNSNNYTATKNLTDGTYYWRVAAKNSGGLLGKASPMWYFIIITHGPSSPGLISPVNDTVYDNYPIFKWSQVEKSVKYNLQICNDNLFNETVINIDTYNSDYKVAVPLSNNSYYWRVRSCGNEGLWGDYSASGKFEVKYAWKIKTSMPTGRYYLSSAVVDNKIYCIGGFDGSETSKNEVYNPQTDSWDTKTPMPTPRAGLGIVAVNGKIYAIGGFNENSNYLNINEMYDPNTDSWREKKEMLQARGLLAIAELNGKIYVIGGMYDQSQNNYHDIEIYDPASDSWEYGTSDAINFGIWMPPEPVATVLEGKIYIVGGDIGGQTIEFNPANNVWETKSSMPIDTRLYLATCAFNDKLYSFGGGIDTQELTSNYLYDPQLDLWIAKRAMPIPRNGLTAAVVGNKIYVIGGNDSKYNNVNEEYTPEFDK